MLLYVLPVVIVVYGLTVQMILGRVLGGVSSEQERNISYPFDAICDAIPKVVPGRRFATAFSKHVAGRVTESDPAVGHFVIKQGWRIFTGTMIVNVTKTDGNASNVSVEYVLSSPYGSYVARWAVDLFFAKLHDYLAHTVTRFSRTWVALYVVFMVFDAAFILVYLTKRVSTEITLLFTFSSLVFFWIITRTRLFRNVK